MPMIKVACIGCGGIQRLHCEHLSALEKIKFVGHCDVEKDRAETAALRFGGEVFTDFKTMYDKAKPHAVYICVPPFAREGMEEAAAERGIHLFIEKPIALNRASVKRIAAAIRSTNVICSVGYCYRYNDTVALARKLLKGKAVSLVNGCWNGTMPQVWWWRKMDKSGGQIVEQSTHMFDLIRYLCGEVAEVYAAAATGSMTKTDGFDVHDSSVVALRLKNGAAGVVASTCVATEGGGRVVLEIVTPEATFELQDGKLTVNESGRVTQYLPQTDMYAEENKAFIEAIRTGKKNRIRSSYPDALKTFMVTAAANDSIHSGLPTKP